MTVNSPVPMASFQDGPRTVSGTLDAADDGTGYEYTFTVAGPGTVKVAFRQNMAYTAGYALTLNGSSASLAKTGGATLKSTSAGYGTFVLTSQGAAFTLRSGTTTLWTVTDPSPVLSGLRMRYTITGGARVTTGGRKL